MLIIPLAIILAVVLVAVIFLGPRLSGIITGQEEISSQKAKLAKLTAKAAFLESLQASELQTKTENSLAFLPAEKDLPRVLSVVRNLAGDNGLELQGVRVGAGDISTGSAAVKTNKNELESLELKVILVGSWDQLQGFLFQIEEASPLMRVAKSDMSFLPPLVEATLLIDSFSLPLPITLGASETPLAAISPQEEEVYRQLVKVIPQNQESLPSITSPSGRENPFVF